MPEAQAGVKRIIFDNYEATVAERIMLKDDLFIVKFRLAKPMSFVAGQYVSTVYPGIKPAPFSIASSPTEHDMIELGIELTGGPNTTRLSNAQPGDKLVLRGPFGNFVIKDERKVCFLAGGVGVTPFMSMLRWVRDTKQDIHAALFYSCRHGEFMWLDELGTMVDCPNIKTVLTCTRETPAAWQYRAGRITEQMIRQELPDFAEYTFYSCGPREFIEAMFAMLRAMGVADNQMKRELW